MYVSVHRKATGRACRKYHVHFRSRVSAGAYHTSSPDVPAPIANCPSFHVERTGSVSMYDHLRRTTATRRTCTALGSMPSLRAMVPDLGPLGTSVPTARNAKQGKYSRAVYSRRNIGVLVPGIDRKSNSKLYLPSLQPLELNLLPPTTSHASLSMLPPVCIVAEEEDQIPSGLTAQMSHIERRYDAEVMRLRARERVDRRSHPGEPRVRAPPRDGRVDIGADSLEEDIGGGPPPIRTLDVTPLPVSFRRAGDLEDRVPLDFIRFVAALGRGGNGRAVRHLAFGMVDFRGTPEEDAARLFGDVLPNHATLEAITFDRCGFSKRQVELFASSLPEASAGLVELHFLGGAVGWEGVHGGLDADSCKLICRAASSSRNLRDLDIRVKEVLADTLDNVAASSSPLLDLTVRVDDLISHECVARLARQLRTNTTMTRLVFQPRRRYLPAEPRDPDLFRPIEEVLETYNVTLESVVVLESDADRPTAAQARMDDLLRRNRHVEHALTMWQQRPGSGNPGERSLSLLAPQLLALAGRLPTLLYHRLLRRGDASELCQLVVHRRAAGAKKRGRETAARLDVKDEPTQEKVP
jgi:hypothetical protein